MNKVIIGIIIILLLIIAGFTLWMLGYSSNPDSCKINQDCIDKSSNGILQPLETEGNWICESEKCIWNVTLEEDLTGKITDDNQIINLNVGIGDKIEF